MPTTRGKSGERTDKLIRALSLLKALRQNTSEDSITEYNSLTTSHVHQFHTILETISSIGIDVSEFFIPDHEVKPGDSSSSWGPGGHADSFSSEKYVRKSIFLTKVDGIINYLKTLLEEEPRKAGFKPPE